MTINQIAFIVLLSFGFIVFLYLLGCEKDQTPKGELSNDQSY